MPVFYNYLFDTNSSAGSETHVVKDSQLIPRQILVLSVKPTTYCMCLLIMISFDSHLELDGL